MIILLRFREGFKLNVLNRSRHQRNTRSTDCRSVRTHLPCDISPASIDIDLSPLVDAAAVHCRARAETVARTGVEMEALTAVQIALLTVYDMCKAVDRGMTIGEVRLMEKSGGKSGHWRRGEE